MAWSEIMAFTFVASLLVMSPGPNGFPDRQDGSHLRTDCRGLPMSPASWPPSSCTARFPFSACQSF